MSEWHVSPYTSEDRLDLTALTEIASLVAIRPSAYGPYLQIQHESIGLCLRKDGALHGFMAFIPRPPIAEIYAFLLLDHNDRPEGTRRLIEAASTLLPTRHLHTLAYVGNVTWAIAELTRAGFRRTNTIITYQLIPPACTFPVRKDIFVRPATERDLPAILRIDHACFEPLWRYTSEELHTWFTRSTFFLVAELHGHLVGYTFGDMLGRHGHLTRLAVHPDTQHTGIGRRLLAEALRIFQAHHAYGVTLNTQQDNVRSRQLYEGCGFTLADPGMVVLTLPLPGSPRQASRRP